MSASVPPGTAGVGRIDQLVPSQRSICSRLPTAKQKFARGHEMPCSPNESGVGISCQLMPFQCSTMGAESKGPAVPEVRSPTAMHEFADEQSTP